MIGWLVDIARARLSGPGSWAVAAALLAVAVLARLALSRWLDPVPFTTFYPAIAAGTLLAGWRRGAVISALSAIAAWYFFVEPKNSFAISDYSAILWIVGFLVVSALLIALVEGLVRAVLKLDAAARVNKDLFRELQHRVANNLQIVAAALQKARRDVTDPTALQAIDHALGRIHSLAWLHRRLYDSAAYSEGIEPILRAVLAETFRDLPVDVRLQIRCGGLTVGEMTAIALLVNEAAINAAKHVFRLKRGSRFEISLAEAERGDVRLTIHDDGPGILAGAADRPEAGRFGLAVMKGLAEQLGGSLETPEGPGATLAVRFSRAAPPEPPPSTAPV